MIGMRILFLLCLTLRSSTSQSQTNGLVTTPLPSTIRETSATTETTLSSPTTESNTTTSPTTEDDDDGSSRGRIIGFTVTILILLIIFGSLIILGCLVAILFRKTQKGKLKVSSSSKINKIARRVSTSVSSVYASFNERRQIRRELQRSTNNSYSRISGDLPPPRPRRFRTFAENTDPLLPLHRRTHIRNGTLSPNYETDTGDYTSPIFSPADMLEDIQRQLMRLRVEEISRDELQFEEEIGRGEFGTVYKALWTFESNAQMISAHVAVKVLSDQSSEQDKIRFLQEAVLMGQFNDPNILPVFGVVTKSPEVMLLCELMDGDLRKHLTDIRERINNGESTESELIELPALLLSYCRKIASSFVYLGLKGFVHRDLAARNILVSKEGDCKLSDFGLSRDLHDDDYYLSNGGMVPVKWTAPEAIMYRKYSPKSDVWSYGILLYEIWSLGQKPYQGMSNSEVVTKIPTGYRLPPPPGCPRSIYGLMIKCTHPVPGQRPAFTCILTSLQKPDYQLLKWKAEDVAASSEEARKLGSPLEEGEILYKELQNTYVAEDSENSDDASS